MRIGVLWSGVDIKKRPQPYQILHACVAGDADNVRHFKLNDDIDSVLQHVLKYLENEDFYWIASNEAVSVVSHIDNERIIKGQWFYPDFSVILRNWCYQNDGVIADNDLLRFTELLQRFFERGSEMYGVEYSNRSIVSSYAKAIHTDASCRGATGLTSDTETCFLSILSEITRDEWVTVSHPKGDSLSQPLVCSLPHVELARELLKEQLPLEPAWKEVPSADFNMAEALRQNKCFIGRFNFKQGSKDSIPELKACYDLLPPNWRGESSDDGGFYLTSSEAHHLYEVMMLPLEKASDNGRFFVYDGDLIPAPQSDILKKFPLMAQFSPVYDLCAHHIVCALCMGNGVPGGERSVLNAWLMAHVRIVLMEYASKFRNEGLYVTGYGLNDVKVWGRYPDAALSAGGRGLLLPHSFFKGHKAQEHNINLLKVA